MAIKVSIEPGHRHSVYTCCLSSSIGVDVSVGRSQSGLITEQVIEVCELPFVVLYRSSTKFLLHFANIHRSSPVSWLFLLREFPKTEGFSPVGFFDSSTPV